MYNAEQKEKFIQSYTDSIETRDEILRYFNILEKYEVEWGADLCTQPAEKLQPAFDSIAGIRKRSGDRPAHILKSYVLWCMENNIPGVCDGMLNIQTGTINRLETSMVTTPAKLQRVLDTICDPESRQTADNCVRAYVWLAFAGMEEEDIFLVRTGDVDFRVSQVHFGGADYRIYPEALASMHNCVELDAFVYEHPNYTVKGPLYRSRVPGDILVRGIRGTYTPSAMKIDLSRRFRAVAKNGGPAFSLSYKRIWLSGVFYRAWEREQAGEPLGFEVLVDRMLERKTYAPSVKVSNMRQKSNKHLNEDYQRWKQLFK